MSTQPDLDMAFPFVSHGGIHEHQVFATGLSKRELFAAMAMQGLHANSAVDMSAVEAAKFAVEQADALIAALNKEPTP